MTREYDIEEITISEEKKRLNRTKFRVAVSKFEGGFYDKPVVLNRRRQQSTPHERREVEENVLLGSLGNN